MYIGFDATGFAAIGETQEDRVVGGGSATGLVDWEVFIYASTRPFITRVADEPSDQPFKGTLEKAYRFDRSIVGSDSIGEAITIGLGEIRLTNIEGDYDFLSVDHTPLGQNVVIKRGDDRYPYSTWQTVLNGYMVDQEIDRDSITFRLRDAGHRIDVPSCNNIYAGTGGVEGGEDLKDKRKPRWFGHVLNVSPPLVIPASLAYQLNDGPIEGVSAAYVRGAELTYKADYGTVALMNSATMTTGQYATCLAEGWLRIAVANDSEIGQVTCDFSGDKAGGVFCETSADIVMRLLTTAADYTEDDLVSASFDALNILQPSPIGYGIPFGSDETVATSVGFIMAGIGGWGGSRRTGKFEVKTFSAPSGTASGNYNSANIIDVRTVTMPRGLQTPSWRVRIGYQRNWTVQTDLAGSVPASRRAFLEEDLRFVSAENQVVRADFPPGQELTKTISYFRDESDALAEAERQLGLWGVSRALYSFRLALPYTHELGQVVEVNFPRFDLSEGKMLRIVETSEDDTNGVEIMAMG